jgi:putative ABC transport system permease protein
MTPMLIWWAGLLRRRWGRLAATACGVAVAVALLAALGQFLAGAQASMTDRATRGVSVDWQVEVQPGADPAAVLGTVRSTPDIRAAVPVGFAATPGLSANTAGSQQTTGPGKVLGLPPDYRASFPGEIRTLVGSDTGVLVAQQTASNLHAQPGDTIAIRRAGLPDVQVRVDGVVDLPQADSLFQKVGAPAGAQPSAPPDNIVLVPLDRWHTLFDPLAADRSDQLTTQVHATLSHNLPADPATAYATVIGAAHNLEARSSGTALVGDNLGAALGAARSDAAYARIMFLFLGLPGAVLAALLTAAVAAAGAGRRRTEQALLRSRGASGRQVLGLAATEALTIGVPGSVLGIGIAAAVGAGVFGSVRFGASTTEALAWTIGAALAGVLIAASTVIGPAARDWRQLTIASSRALDGRRSPTPVWQRLGLDFVLLAAAVLVFLATGSNQYQLVLAPEGVPSISVSYWAFAAPALLWVGGALLTWRLAGTLAGTVAGSMARRRRLLTRSIVLLGLAIAFAGSTAVFNQTYRAQAEVDAKLTNGADVTVTESPGSTVGPEAAAQLAAVPGVRSVEPVQHRFGYVGADLQDLYGVRPDTITSVTALQDSYFQGGTARELMARLAAQPDAILVSAETVKDFQLHQGDLLNLRLPDARTGQAVTVPFHYAGIVSEFPTAPKDSFLVANASYLAQRTGNTAVGAFLVDTGGGDTAAVANRISTLLGPSATVTDISTTRGKVGSSLTAVDLAGLTRVELAFALVLAAGSGGLVLALGLNERRRGFAITRALGATRRQLRVFIAGETSVVVVGGVLAGIALGWWLTKMLIAVLTGVFDPPPAGLAVPWAYLAALTATVAVALLVASTVIARRSGREEISAYRDI